MIKYHTIAIDFDNTIFRTDYPAIRELVPHADKAIHTLAKDNTLILWTCRTGEWLDKAIEALQVVGLGCFTYINDNTKEDIELFSSSGIGRKINADIYIDDKGLGTPLRSDNTVNWYGVMKLLNQF